MRRALALLTIVGGSREPTPATWTWFPLVGAAVGTAVGSAWWVAQRWWPPLVAGLIAVVVDLVLTGMLHVDGVADCGDGLIAPLSRERRLAAMADPSLGAFGVVSVVVVLFARTTSFATAPVSIAAVAGLWCAARTAMAVVAHVIPYARPGGLASALLGARSRVALAVSCVAGGLGSALLVAFGAGARGLAALAGELVAAALVAALARRRLGGFTGDVLGALGVVGETVGLVILAGR